MKKKISWGGQELGVEPGIEVIVKMYKKVRVGVGRLGGCEPRVIEIIVEKM